MGPLASHQFCPANSLLLLQVLKEISKRTSLKHDPDMMDNHNSGLLSHPHNPNHSPNPNQTTTNM